MTVTKNWHLPTFYIIYFFLADCNSYAQSIQIKNDISKKIIFFSNQKISAALDYNKKACISFLNVNGQNVIRDGQGIYTKIRTKNTTYSTLYLLSNPVVNISKNRFSVSGISFGDDSLSIRENWTFTLDTDNIKFSINRFMSRAVMAEQVAFPFFMFNNMDTWEGAFQDYGGLAWFYLFNKKLDTYGVHSGSSRFWNSKTGNGLTIEVHATGKQVAMDYSRTQSDNMAFSIAISDKEMQLRFDTGTNRRRFIRDRVDVWAPVEVPAGKTTENIKFSYFDFKSRFNRGSLVGINGEEVSAVLNTIARIGVIDKQHFGGNSWHTPYGPICLHEQYIAQLGLAINDSSYLKGYKECLDFYRDNAIKPDGRVWPRWAYSNEDAMGNEYTDKGFYEAQWGYLLDSNPDFVTNVSDLFNQTGDLKWIKTQQFSCEKALDWILKRDFNNNGLVEVETDDHQQKKGSDWIDIIWAAYENAFLNAKLYHALVLWADIERHLGNIAKAKYYELFAAKLKSSFNKAVSNGGFWDDENKCYVHWRDKNGSIHGNNMVTPVNFMAIAYGICDDRTRIKLILDTIEVQMQTEDLFFWPICLYSYHPGEGNDWQFPFPNYENGDIFLSWGSVAVQAYASYKPALALKYVKKVLAQYAKDGLAFQRYGRLKQDGLGDDILSGNSLSVVGLYQAIYGVNPLYNRFFLNPHITPQLSGTTLNYFYRDQKLLIDLDMNKYAVSNGLFKIISKTSFGFFSGVQELLFFSGSSDHASLKVRTMPNCSLTLNIETWGSSKMTWFQSAKNLTPKKLVYQINDLKPRSYYTILTNDKVTRIKSNAQGSLIFEYQTSTISEKIAILNK